MLENQSCANWDQSIVALLIQRGQIQLHDFRILRAAPVLKTTTSSSGLICPLCTSVCQAIETNGRFRAEADAFQAHAALQPFDDATPRAGHGAAAAGPDGVEHHEVADRGRARAGRWPGVGVRETARRSGCPPRNAVTIGAQPSLWQLISRGSRSRAQPAERGSS